MTRVRKGPAQALPLLVLMAFRSASVQLAWLRESVPRTRRPMGSPIALARTVPGTGRALAPWAPTEPA
jgi:hypothetical protein